MSNTIPIAYEEARSIIFGALNFAQKIGFEPHPDWQYARLILEPERPFDDKYTFGRKGKPFYVAGPFDKKERNIKSIINTVVQHGGDWVVPISDNW